MEGLVEFLTARLDEREALARATEHNDGPTTLEWRRGGQRNLRFDNGCSDSYESVFAGRWDRILIARDTVKGGPLAEHIAANDPAFVLADIAAKRRIVELHYSDRGDCALCAGEEDFSDDADGNREWYRQAESHPCRTLRLLALPFSGHRDYRQEWQPS